MIKKGIVAICLSVFALEANAKILDIEVEKGTSLVEISWSFMATGCGGSERILPTIYSEDLNMYVVGVDATYVPIDPSILENPLRFPITCQAEVIHTSIAKFLVSSKIGESVKVSVPDHFLGTIEISQDLLSGHSLKY